MIDPLMAATCASDGAIPAEVREPMTVSVAAFLACGGQITLAEWSAMSAESKAIAHEAARRVYAVRAQEIARAILREQMAPSAPTLAAASAVAARAAGDGGA